MKLLDINFVYEKTLYSSIHVRTSFIISFEIIHLYSASQFTEGGFKARF
jgi:hypothetical protein